MWVMTRNSKLKQISLAYAGLGPTMKIHMSYSYYIMDDVIIAVMRCVATMKSMNCGMLAYRYNYMILTRYL